MYGYPVRRYRATRFPPSRVKVSLAVPPSAMVEQRYRRLPTHVESSPTAEPDDRPSRGAVEQTGIRMRAAIPLLPLPGYRTWRDSATDGREETARLAIWRARRPWLAATGILVAGTPPPLSPTASLSLP